jgi:hypothetical protein
MSTGVHCLIAQKGTDVMTGSEALSQLNPIEDLPVPILVDRLLALIPDLIEPDKRTLEVSKAKRAEFGHVVCNVEHLRHVIRQYYRNVNI